VVLVASRNTKKVAELERILRAVIPQVRVLGLADVAPYDEPVEDQPTFAGNALLKSRAGLAATGLPTIADDSGLCVEALNGMPGVLSARWAGPPKSDARNNDLLLAQLGDVPRERRAAYFECAIAFTDPAGVDIVEHGRMSGRVIGEVRGSGGFGYDGLFVADEYAGVDPERTTAELTVPEKDAISHRGRALADLAPKVAAVLLTRGG
jgi:XTP/dITP diphosphohydrolase